MSFRFLRNAGLLLILFVLAGCGNHTIPPVTDLSPVDKRKTVYLVKKGDTLHLIAFRTGIAYQKLALWNGIGVPYQIYVGDQLALRPGTAKQAPRNKPASTAGKTASTKSTGKPASTRKSSARPASKPVPEAKLPTRVAGWKWPAKGKLTQTFSKPKGRYGIQIAARRGAPITAAASGQVVYAGEGITGYGELVIVKHSETYLSAYAHNDRILVKEGERVKVGQQLAMMGSSGTRSVKLHFEVRKDGVPVNPLSYLPRK